jgi:hypothetical protein
MRLVMIESPVSAIVNEGGLWVSVGAAQQTSANATSVMRRDMGTSDEIRDL